VRNKKDDDINTGYAVTGYTKFVQYDGVGYIYLCAYPYVKRAWGLRKSPRFQVGLARFQNFLPPGCLAVSGFPGVFLCLSGGFLEKNQTLSSG
jgi:hypothetical protein